MRERVSLLARWAKQIVAVSGLAALTGALLSASAAPATRRAMLLDSFLPSSHYRNAQTARIQAPPWAVIAAVRAVTPGEVQGLVPLAIALRAPQFRLTPREEALLRRPMLDAMQQENFVLLGERAGEEIVLGAIGRFWAERYVPLRNAAAFRSFRDPRFARVAMNVRVRGDGQGGALVTTETRVLCPDPAARRQFDRYWRLWSPGGAVVRGQWLAAVRRRAERAPRRSRRRGLRGLDGSVTLRPRRSAICRRAAATRRPR